MPLLQGLAEDLGAGGAFLTAERLVPPHGEAAGAIAAPWHQAVRSE